MTTTDSNIDIWRDLIQAGAGQHRLISDHPLHLYFGSDVASRPTFFLLTNVEPRTPHLAGPLTSEVRHREDGRWVSVLTLTDGRYTENFMGICLELSRRTADVTSELAGVHRFDSTLSQWQKLLTKLSLRALSKEQMRGLFAELSFARILADATSTAEMLSSWTGPRGSAQDFRHPTLGLFEVKAVGPDARSINVSSVEQLDPSPEQKVDLIVCLVEEDPLGHPESGSTLPEAILGMRESLGDRTAEIEAFDEAIALVGIDTSDGRYEQTRFRVIDQRCFRVEGEFPRLRREQIPAGVEHIRYEVKLQDLERFGIELNCALIPIVGVK